MLAHSPWFPLESLQRPPIVVLEESSHPLHVGTIITHNFTGLNGHLEEGKAILLSGADARVLEPRKPL